MHLMIGALNRKGRKRKSGKRTASGRLVAEKVDFKAFVAAQPHRNWLPEPMRTHERAESILGCLSLQKQISEEQYEAGRRFSVIVGAFRQAIGSPRGTVGSGRGYSCNPSLCSRDEAKCVCEVRTANYRNACSYLQSAGQKAYNITYQVVISEMVPTLEQMPQLIWGLNALERGFGLTAKRKSG